MSGRIFLIDEDGGLQELLETPYQAEEKLQSLIARYPDLMPGEQINPSEPRRWLFVAREEGVPDRERGGARWSLDHLFLDQDAIPTLVEVKRSSDSRIRREIVGQMLDYAANAVVHWPVEQVRASFNRTCEEAGEEPEEVLSTFLDEAEHEAFWRQVKTNLQAGRIRMVFLADEIPSELTRVVEFLNEQMDPAEVLAVEVPQYVGGGLQTLTPRVLGVTAGAQRRKSAGERPSTSWDRDSFLDALEDNCGAGSREAVEQIMEWAETHLPRPTYGTGTTNASFTPALDLQGTSYWPFAVYFSGHVEIKFQYLVSWAPFDRHEKREELRQRLNDIEGVSISPDRLEKRPSFEIQLLEEPNKLTHFLETMEWCMEEIRTQVLGS